MTTTMCIKRAGLVWALVLLTTTCFILTCAAPHGDERNSRSSGSKDNGDGNPTENAITTNTSEPPIVSTTPPVTPTDGMDSSKKTTKETSDTPAVSSDDGAEGYLYYEIKKCIIFECNLTLSDINYILRVSQNDEEDQFMYALADKLGYMSDGHNDPHIPVIRKHRDKLIELLEKMAAKKEPKPSLSQEDNEGPSVSSNAMPASKEPPSPSDINKIAFEVSADIRGLGPDVIQDILSDATFSDALGYAVGRKLHYSQGDKYKYLENADTDELKKILQRTLESKTTSKTTSDGSIDNSRSEPAPSEGGQEAGNINGNGDPRQEGESDRVSEEAGETSNSLLPQNNGGTQDTQKQTLPPTVEPPTKEKEDDLQVTKPSAKPEPGAEDVLSIVDEKMKEETPTNEEDSRGKDGDPNNVRPSPNNVLDDEHERTDQFSDNDDGGDFELLSRIDEAEHKRLLNSDEFHTFLKTTYNMLFKQFVVKEADPYEIDLALEEYLEFPSVSGRSGDSVTKDGEGGDNESSKVEAVDGDVPEKAKEDTGSPDQPLDSDVQAKGASDSLGNDDKDDVEYDHPRSSSSFGALHFLSIFLVLGVLVVIGYFCMHNRKKIREGVATYIKDSSKHRRRAREYKPLIST